MNTLIDDLLTLARSDISRFLKTFCQQGLTEGVICVAGLFVSDCINCTVS